MSGRFIAVVGPSGVGKDSVMTALAAERPDIVRARRVITRGPQAGGEDYDAVSPARFAARLAAGDFALHWQAHGLSYGIPAAVQDHVRRGHDVLANLSRSKLIEAGQVFRSLHILHVTARADVLARRLAERGRESEAEIAGRLSRASHPLPDGLRVTEIDNSGPLKASVKAAMDALYPERVQR